MDFLTAYIFGRFFIPLPKFKNGNWDKICRGLLIGASCAILANCSIPAGAIIAIGHAAAAILQIPSKIIPPPPPFPYPSNSSYIIDASRILSKNSHKLDDLLSQLLLMQYELLIFICTAPFLFIAPRIFP